MAVAVGIDGSCVEVKLDVCRVFACLRQPTYHHTSFHTSPSPTIASIFTMTKSRPIPRRKLASEVNCFMFIIVLFSISFFFFAVPSLNDSQKSGLELRLESFQTSVGIKTKSEHKKQPTGPNCEYEGHCPVGTTCVASTKTCELYQPMAGVANQACVSVCQSELEWDEHFYHEGSFPLVNETFATNNGGCLLIYRRTKQVPDNRWDKIHSQDHAAKPNEVPYSTEQWVNNRFRYIRRVDPWEPEIGL